MAQKSKKKKKRRVKGNEKFFRHALKFDDVLRSIYDLFFKPVANLVAIPEEGEETFAKQLDIIMGGGDRTIRECDVTRPIEKMPGQHYTLGGRQKTSTGRRQFPVGWKCLVLLDKRVKSRVRVELFKKWEAEESWVFALTPIEFQGFLNYIESTKVVKHGKTRTREG